MSSTQQGRRQAGAGERVDKFDAVIVGAGFAGLYALHKLRDEMGLSARVLDAGDGVGGTWYWNRYPGARSDTSSWIYCYSFDEGLLQEWQWSERYPQQHEVLGYLEHVADRFDLNRDIQLGTRVTEATFDEETKRWEVRTDTGDVVSARFLVAADRAPCRRRTCRTSPAWRASTAIGITPPSGPKRASTSPARGSGSSIRVPPASRSPRRSPSRRIASPSSSVPPTTPSRSATAR